MSTVHPLEALVVRTLPQGPIASVLYAPDSEAAIETAFREVLATKPQDEQRVAIDTLTQCIGLLDARGYKSAAAQMIALMLRVIPYRELELPNEAAKVVRKMMDDKSVSGARPIPAPSASRGASLRRR